MVVIKGSPDFTVLSQISRELASSLEPKLISDFAGPVEKEFDLPGPTIERRYFKGG
jgi:hypothetical protein